MKIKDLDQEYRDECQAFTKPEISHNEVAMTNDRQIVVPSFGTITDIFKNHLITLRQLKQKID